ncbi:MAG: shikimate kinase [Syntrophomonadaceae bacterium]|nr:shikimate kinase [Syntrophomonadaceae bacterium]
MEKNIVLIGFMGTGKSTVGMKLAQRFKRKFVDMDKEIERVVGMTVSEIFKRYGEIRFRSEEKLMAHKLARESGLVIATGGGVVLEQVNMDAFSQNGIIICLEAVPNEILERVNRKKGTRPLLKKSIQLQDIEEMLKARESLYAQAEYRVSTSGKSPEQIVNEIIEIVRREE